MPDLNAVGGFAWDDGNARKNSDQHAVYQSEVEQMFLNSPPLGLLDEKHSKG